ncbi:MAG: UDP-N-acetylmuramate dehydrogenase, partial [Calditrichaeota bacterium]|nr:UDP-N-acetylmuramate dehydrogenase [Calditrichota bacterium]
VHGVVVKISKRMSSYSIEGTCVKAQAGVWMPCLSHAVGNMGLTGLEHTIGIPGTLGGLVVMNGGSQHKCIGDVVQEVNVINSEGQIRSLSREDCEFSYRSSAMQKSGLVVTNVELEVKRDKRQRIRREMLELLRERSEKFPLKTPNCGSVFVGSKEMHESFGQPGRVIEETGLKGLRVGGAQVSHKHANFIVNLGGATSADVLKLIGSIRQAVYNRTGIWMKCEVRYVSPDCQILPAHEVLKVR